MPGETKPGKERADKLLVALGLADSRVRAQDLITSGAVRYKGAVVTKAGQFLPVDAELSLQVAELPYVSRGGLKLQKALNVFQIDPAGLTCLDVGASTGGFTDCLLRNGASKVYAVDVGYDQLDQTLRQDSRIINLERTNFRYLEAKEWAHTINLAVSDVSFISLRYIFERLPDFLAPDGRVIALIKPQFEAGQENIGKNGVVREAKIHLQVLSQVREAGQRAGLHLLALDWSPLKGPKGNIEFLSLWCFSTDGGAGVEIDFKEIVNSAHRALADRKS